MTERDLIRRAREYAEDIRRTLNSGQSDASEGAGEGGAVPERARALFARMAARSPSKDVPAVGQVWVAKPAKVRGAATLVALTRADAGLGRCVVLTSEAWIADDKDLVFGGDACPGGEALAACLFLDVPIHRSSLTELVGHLREDALTALLMSLQSRLSGGYTRTPAGSVAGRTLPAASRALGRLLRWTLRAEDGRSVELLTGTSLDDDDPRHEPRALLDEATRWIPDQALAALEAAHEASENESLQGLIDRLVRALSRFAAPGLGDPTLFLPIVGAAVSVRGLAAVSMGGLSGGLVRELMRASPERQQVLVPLGNVAVTVTVERTEREVLLGIHAVGAHDRHPVAGVELALVEGVHRSSRVTDVLGSVSGVLLPIDRGFSLELRHGEHFERIDV